MDVRWVSFGHATQRILDPMPGAATATSVYERRVASGSAKQRLIFSRSYFVVNVMTERKLFTWATSNHAMERTPDRCAITFEMTSTLSARATRALVRRR